MLFHHFRNRKNKEFHLLKIVLWITELFLVNCQIKISMKNSIHKIYLHRHFLLFILLFAYLQSIYTRITVRQEINVYIFTPEAALGTLLAAGILFLIILFFIRKWQKSDTFSTQIMLKIFGSSIISYLLTIKIIEFLISLSFNTIERNFNQKTFVLSAFSDFLDGFIYGSYFLVYYYYNKNKNHQIQLVKYHQVLSQNRIIQLKSQLNPHFLFNNLNVLDQLIEEDKQKASDFLNDFADIYRYILQASDKELINIDQEVDFALNYFNLIQHKYGNAYQLNIETKKVKGFIVPLTLQLLIENAVQHNIGTQQNPVFINININEHICISNNKNLKQNKKKTSGRALKNLKEQYELISEKPIEVNQTEEEFYISVPIIYKQSK
jgi:sensor histidine kinase YesM